MGPIQQDRLRVHPEIRFAPREEVIDLNVLSDRLRHEPQAGQHGHWQEALFHHSHATIALYAFEPGSFLADHVVDGPVVIHLLDGHITVTTDTDTYQLQGGMLLRLAGGIRHDVTALENSHMLLTVLVEGPSSHAIT